MLAHNPSQATVFQCQLGTCTNEKALQWYHVFCAKPCDACYSVTPCDSSLLLCNTTPGGAAPMCGNTAPVVQKPLEFRPAAPTDTANHN